MSEDIFIFPAVANQTPVVVIEAIFRHVLPYEPFLFVVLLYRTS